MQPLSTAASAVGLVISLMGLVIPFFSRAARNNTSEASRYGRGGRGLGILAVLRQKSLTGDGRARARQGAYSRGAGGSDVLWGDCGGEALEDFRARCVNSGNYKVRH
jgi:hypothetical protein